ncbi:hypothetical protein PsorP6_002948 [Peronosclerospora sorghi]|uniref:Uncharacterized protein n=1 Tax=Peronosclerospora sorghi TaxID=230839 RepID=A0ACC0VQ13_9STRA|nr:hypothetical protein PsorP6_002948 [Peronosclerospora sorghi]
MAITSDVKNQLFTSTHAGNGQLIRLPSQAPSPTAFERDNHHAGPFSTTNGRAWTVDEHDRFLQGLELFPSGPWKKIAAHVGTRTTRQTMTHAQKYREKIARRKRGLRSAVKPTRSFKRRHDAHPPQKAASTTTARLDGPAGPLFLFAPCVDDMYNACPDAPDVSHVGAMWSDVDPLPMSEAEIDLILEAATHLPTPPPHHALARAGCFVL